MESLSAGVWHKPVTVAVDDASVAVILSRRFEDGQAEGCPEITSAEGNAIAKYKAVRRVERIELDAEEVATGDVVAH